jgi:hypothetical protein
MVRSGIREISGHEKSHNKVCPIQQQKEGNHQRYEQCNGDKKDAKQKDEQSEESYERKCQNLDTKDQYLEKKQKVVPK